MSYIFSALVIGILCVASYKEPYKGTPYRPCQRCGKKGNWYSHCPSCQAKIAAEYERIRREEAARKKAG